MTMFTKHDDGDDDQKQPKKDEAEEGRNVDAGDYKLPEDIGPKIGEGHTVGDEEVR